MAGLQFSVPYNGDTETLETLFQMKQTGGNSIREIYLNAPQEVAGSGRVGARVEMDEFLGTVGRIHAEGIRVDITMNSTCDGADWYEPEVVSKTMGHIRTFHEEYGVEAITLANPIYITEARRLFPDLEISASVLADIDCYSKALVYAKAGANTITVDVNINRDLKLLQKITVDTGVELKLMVNEGCLAKCPYRKFHMNYISHRSRDIEFEGNDFSFACGQITLDDPSQLFQSGWIRPEDLRRYEPITRFFKIVGRDMLKSKVIRCTKAYLDENYEGNLFDLLCSNLGYYAVSQSAHIDNKALDRTDFFHRLSTCNRKCYKCTYCSNLTKKMLGFGWITRENLEDLGRSDLADAITQQFHGRYPVCVDFSSEPRNPLASPAKNMFHVSMSSTDEVLGKA